MGEINTIFWVENPKGKYHMKGLDVDGKIILEWVLGKWLGGCGLDPCGCG
jgi:hypothetical protein